MKGVTLIRVALAAVIWGAGYEAFAADTLTISPRPKPRPVVVAPAVKPASQSAVAVSLRPVARPKRLTQSGVTKAAQVKPKTSAAANGSVCGDKAIIGKPIAPITARLTGCGLKDGVNVISVAGVALTAPATLDCKTANALKTWVETGVKPAFRRKGGGVHAVQVAASYSCRTRNNRKGARISEHGRGRAIDISAILLSNGTLVTVQKGWGSMSYGKALKAARKSACGPFNTVLGPGSDRFHSDHFHLDTARGRGPYCR
ncbi:MAG: extensin family protein [Albidovulum sp.]